MLTEIWASTLVDTPYNAAHDLNKVHCKSIKEAYNGRTYEMDNSQPLQ